jgi:hypothetical protein
MHEKEVFVPLEEEVEEATLLREPDYVSFNLSEMHIFLEKSFAASPIQVPLHKWNAMFTSGLYKTDSTFPGEQRILFNRAEFEIFILHTCWDTMPDYIWDDLPKYGETMSGAFESARLDFSSPLYLPYTSTTFTAHTWEIPRPFDQEAEFEPVRTTWHLVDGGLISPYLLQNEEALVTFECDAMTFHQAETFASAAVNKIKALWRSYRQRKRAKIWDRIFKECLKNCLKECWNKPILPITHLIHNGAMTTITITYNDSSYTVLHCD